MYLYLVVAISFSILHVNCVPVVVMVTAVLAGSGRRCARAEPAVWQSVSWGSGAHLAIVVARVDHGRIHHWGNFLHQDFDP